jgi:hypothetical protein
VGVHGLMPHTTGDSTRSAWQRASV